MAPANPDSLGPVSTLHLLVELMYGGESKLIPDLEPLEPISFDLLVETLSRRAQKNFGGDVDAWCEWFLHDETAGTQEDRTTLAHMLKVKKQTDYYYGKLSKKDEGAS